jgi:ankyrin repeat protein
VKLAIALGNDVNAHAVFGDYKMEGDVEYTLLYYPHNIADLLDLGTGDPRWSGSTALHGAILANQPAIVQYLVDHGAKLDAKTDLGWTPLMMARGVFLANTGREFPAAEKILTKALTERGSTVTKN